MLMSKLLGRTLRDKPAEATLPSHVFLLRGGYIRNVGSGIYSLLTPAVKIQKKIENIIRDEMGKIGGQEILLPVTLPAELWKESGRFSSVGNELLRFKDRANRDMVLAMTHEEAVVHLARSEAKSYLDYPFMVYQIQTKFRDEPRARAGLIRVREFTMKDAYSFHTSQADLEQYYEKVHKAYENIFKRVGLDGVVSICSDSGMMGGNIAHEFIFLSPAGEDSIVLCDNCGYKANMEVAVSNIDKESVQTQKLKEVYTPKIKTIDDLASSLNISKIHTVKAVVYLTAMSNQVVIVFLRGDLHVNEAKLRNVLGEEIRELPNPEDYGLKSGYIGPCEDFHTKFKVIYDKSLAGEENLVCGANKHGYHKTGFSMSRDITVPKFFDVYKVETSHKCAHCGGNLTVRRGIEVGNIFQLGKKYTETMHMTYTDKDGKLLNPVMGCYGIGVGRLLACIVENSHDDKGPIWPKSVAPWQVEICALNLNQDEVKNVSYELYSKLSKKYDVLFDDRNLAAGAQFADADLLGVPIRVIVSKRNLAENKIEVKVRSEKDYHKVDLNDVMGFIESFWNM